jgi:hypothetical protein
MLLRDRTNAEFPHNGERNKANVNLLHTTERKEANGHAGHKKGRKEADQAAGPQALTRSAPKNVDRKVQLHLHRIALTGGTVGSADGAIEPGSRAGCSRASARFERPSIGETSPRCGFCHACTAGGAARRTFCRFLPTLPLH